MQNHELLSDLMDRYGTAILHLAYSFVRNRQTAEDLSQEIFIKCYQKLHTFNGNSAIQTWMYRIAVNHCKDYIKSWHYRKVHASEYITTLVKGHQHGPEAHYFTKVDQEELINDIFRLPIKYREVIMLTYFHELSMSEISDVCGVNINTVKARVAKAKKLLKKSITERSPEHGKPIKEPESQDAKGRIGKF